MIYTVVFFHFSAVNKSFETVKLLAQKLTLFINLFKRCGLSL